MTDIDYMKVALREATKAYKKGEVPVGAVIVYQDKIIAKAHNLREHKNSVFAHAEAIAIAKANKHFKCFHLEGCTLYITLEPCPMCAGAIVQSRISKVVYGAPETKGGCAGSFINLLDMKFQAPKIELTKGILEEECASLMKAFFIEIRKK